MPLPVTRWLAAASLTAALVCAWAPRVESASEPFAHLPRQEYPGRQIGWVQNETLDAFTRAVDTNKPMVVVFGDRRSRYFTKQAELALPCPHVNQLAGHAVFAIAMPDTDEYARRLAQRLKLTTYPTISVMAPRKDKPVELYRMEGFFDAETIATDLRKVIWPKGQPEPPKLSSNALAYPNMACTPEGARRLGFKEATPGAPPVSPAPPPPGKPAQPVPKPYGEAPKLASTGSGFLVGWEGHMLTNHHVVERCRAVDAVVPVSRLRRESVRERMRVLRTDPRNDLALLLFERLAAKRARSRGPANRGELGFIDNATPLSLACDDQVLMPMCLTPGRGTRVYAAGYPLRGMLTQMNLTEGIVSSIEPAAANQPELIQFTAPIQGGNSGGPLIDERGHVVGVVVSTLSAIELMKTGRLPQNVNFAVPASAAAALLKGHVEPRAFAAAATRRLDSQAVAGSAELSTFPLECSK